MTISMSAKKALSYGPVFLRTVTTITMDIESIRESLSLPLLPGDEPFGLSETERLDPEDWAWLFLRMNGD